MTEVEQLREALRQKQAVIEDLERRLEEWENPGVVTVKPGQRMELVQRVRVIEPDEEDS